MKLISEYIFAAMFFVASGLSFYIGSNGAGIVCAALGVYFPTRAGINELYAMISNWNISRAKKLVLFVLGIISFSSVFHLILLELTHLFGILGIALLVYLDASKKRT